MENAEIIISYDFSSAGFEHEHSCTVELWWDFAVRDGKMGVNHGKVAFVVAFVFYSS